MSDGLRNSPVARRHFRARLRSKPQAAIEGSIDADRVAALRAGHHEVSALAGPKIPAHSLAACVARSQEVVVRPAKARRHCPSMSRARPLVALLAGACVLDGMFLVAAQSIGRPQHSGTYKH